MSDVCVTVPKNQWEDWLLEGDLPGEPWSEMESYFFVSSLPKIMPGERVYVVAHGRLRGYAPLVRTDDGWGPPYWIKGRRSLVRRGGAVAVTIPQTILGFRGWRYRFWPREIEVLSLDWMKP